MRKVKLVIALALAGTLLTGGLAYASPGETMGTKATPANQASKLDPAVRQQVKDKWAELNSLRTQIRDLDKQFGLGRRTGAAAKHRRFTDDTLKPLLQQFKDLARQIKAAREANDTEKVKALEAQLTAVRGQLEAKRGDAKSLGDKVKGLRDEVNAERDAIKAALAPMKPLKDQIHILLQEMRALNGGLQADRRDAKDAMKQKDGAGVLAALDKAIAAEREVLAKKTALLDLQKQVGTALQNAAK